MGSQEGRGGTGSSNRFLIDLRLKQLKLMTKSLFNDELVYDEAIHHKDW
ncbi:hypothetical protein [Sphingobacterium sp.]